MQVQIKGPVLLAKNLPTNADWSSISLKGQQLSDFSLVFETAGVTTATGQFFIETRNGDPMQDIPFSQWQALPLATPLILGNANLQQTVLLQGLIFSELRARFASNVSNTGTFTVWMLGRGGWS